MGIELAKAFIAIRADQTQLPGDLNQAKRTTENSMRELSGSLQGIIGGVMGAVAGAGMLAKGLRLAGQLEQDQIAFETMLGSAEEAKKVLKDLAQFAAETPFEMPELRATARGLVTFGERGEEMMETLKMLGDAASGASTDFSYLGVIFNQIRGAGRLMRQDFMQLSSRGVLSLKDIADYLGTTDMEAANKALSTGKIKFEDVRKILQKLTGEGGRFYNMMARQSQTLLGLTSTLKDGYTAVLRSIGEAVMPIAKPLVRLGIIFTDAFSNMMTTAGPFLKTMTSVSLIIPSIVIAIKPLIPLLRSLGVAFLRAFPYAAIVGLIAGIIAKIASWVSSSKKITEAWSKMVEKVKMAWSTVWSAIKPILERLWATLMRVFGVDVGGWADSVEGALSAAINWIGEFILDAAEWFNILISNWDLVWSAMKDALKMYLSFMLDMVMNAMIEMGRMFMLEMPSMADLFEPSDRTKDLAKNLAGAMSTLMDLKREMEEAREKAMKEAEAKKKKDEDAAAAGKATSGLLDTGMYGIPELGKKIQEKMLGKDDKKEEKEMVALLDSGKKIQEEMLAEMKKPKMAVGALA